MPGSLLQLVAIGSEDIYITGNPQITFFKSIYKKYSNFSIEGRDVLFIGKDKLNYNNPTKLFIELPHYGHLISDIFLELELPDIFSENRQFRWIKDIGTSIINSIKLYIDGILIEELDGDYIKYYYETSLSNTKKHSYNEMIGNIEKLNNPYRNIEDIYTKYEKNKQYTNQDKNWYNRYYNTIPSIEGRRLILPLPFWFSRYDGLQIPIVSLKNKIKMEFELKPIRELYVLGITETITLNSSKDSNNETISTINEKRINRNNEILYENNTVNKTTYVKPNLIEHEIKNYTLLQENEWDLNPILNINYIFLDESEKKLIENYEHRIVIDRILKKEIIGKKGSNILDVELFHPTKELIFQIQRDDVREFNEHSNFTNFDEPLLGKKFKNYQNYFYNLCYKQYTEIKNKHDQISKNYNDIINSQYPVSVGQKTDYQPAPLNISPVSLLGKFRTDGLKKPYIDNTDNEFNYQFKRIDGVTNYPIITFQNNIWNITNDHEPKIATLDSAYLIEVDEALTTRDIYNFVNLWEYRNQYEIPSINYNNYKFFSENIVKSMGILFNGDIRLDDRDYHYFNKEQILNHHSNKIDNGTFIYSFSIYPENYQPTGACNFTALKKVEFRMELKEPELFENINKNKYKYNIKIYTSSYNILQISNKTGKLLYNIS